MGMSSTDMADEMKSGLGFGEPTSQKNKDFAKAIVEHLQTGIVSFLPGTINGTAPPSGGPLSNGTGVGGTILLVPGDIQTRLVAAFGISTPQILAMGTAISTHFATGLVSFASGDITGTCSNTPVSPGVLVGEGMNGVIGNVSGSTLATLISLAIGETSVSSELQGMCDAVVNHVINNAIVTFATGTVTGVCSAGGGPIVGGAAVGGTIA